nr:uncharacterized protein LOC123774575 [Procambarus clarkii]
MCYHDNRYRRHPLYCNSYYYCIWDGFNWNFPIFTCPAALLFDEKSQQCSYPDDTVECIGNLAPYPTPQPDSEDVTPTTTPSVFGTTASNTTISPIETTTDIMEVETTTVKIWELDKTSQYDCPAPGYYPFEGDCVRFYRCFETLEGKLKGLRYKCPPGYGYSEPLQRCKLEADLPPCMKKLQAAHLRLSGAIRLSSADLIRFFGRE